MPSTYYWSTLCARHPASHYNKMVTTQEATSTFFSLFSKPYEKGRKPKWHLSCELEFWGELHFLKQGCLFDIDKILNACLSHPATISLLKGRNWEPMELAPFAQVRSLSIYRLRQSPKERVLMSLSAMTWRDAHWAWKALRAQVSTLPTSWAALCCPVNVQPWEVGYCVRWSLCIALHSPNHSFQTNFLLFQSHVCWY